MARKSYASFKTEEKSFGEKVRDDIVFLVIICSIYFVFEQLFRVILFPFRLLFMSGDQKEEHNLRRARKKVCARNEYHKNLQKDPQDLMYQYYERFIEHPDQYKDDPDNEAYKRWHDDWLDGKILDSGMRWAPKVSFGKKLNEAFVNYAAMQVELHSQASAADKMRFLHTLKKYYPELTPTINGARDDLDSMKKIFEDERLSREIVKDLCKRGVPRDTAKKLVQQGLEPHELKKKADIIHLCGEHNFCESGAEYILTRNLPVDSDEAEFANVAAEKNMTHNSIDAFLEGKITKDDALELCRYINVDCVYEEGEPGRDEAIEDMLNTFIKKNRKNAERKGVWE